MSETITLTSKGQITIPKRIRKTLNLEKGDKLEIFVDEEGIRIVPVLKNPLETLRKLRQEVRFDKDEIEQMIRESKKAWDNL
ncbi:MAG: AbrB/MazE/SpoVT family DNA-binding domain-containing protein [Candidatus Wukongarchaeota archaeon]|nr:AbrB/MazE/SpoVT family DNA-binding domain-containing protein [Candidatus Wukongarchaeota archaeon]